MRTTSHYLAEDSVNSSSFEELRLSLKPKETIELPVMSGMDFDVAGWFGFQGVIWSWSGEVGVVSFEISNV
jgi:hypothetical protein